MLGSVCAGVGGCRGLCASGLVGPCWAMGDVVPQWCQWCDWTRAALRVPACHGMRRCGGRNSQIWRRPSSCLTTSSSPPRTGVSLGHRRYRGQGRGPICIHGTGRARGTPHLAMATWHSWRPWLGAGRDGGTPDTHGLTGLGIPVPAWGVQCGHRSGRFGTPGWYWHGWGSW